MTTGLHGNAQVGTFRKGESVSERSGGLPIGPVPEKRWQQV